MTETAPVANGPIAPLAQSFLQLIDDGGDFTADETQLSTLVASTLDSPHSANYSLVGIMGCQSSGKSTLLNLLFGCQFREMDSLRGRGQTTKGVWLDTGNKALQAQSAQSLAVMDLEGTDSGERGEDRTTFERQTSLFALALSNILILNMWEHDIGRYTASNYGILKTIFEVNLTLFAPSTKTLLLFVIRDHIASDTPLAALQEKLTSEIHKIWGELRKPAGFESTPLDALFVFAFESLPHKKLEKELFAQGIDRIRNKFLDSSDSGYFFAPLHGTAKQSVPAEGFGHYARSLWTTIKENKELNLPTQKEMLATYRCDEITGQLLRKFTDTIADIREAIASSGNHLIDDFGPCVNGRISEALAEYDTLTKYYHTDIVQSKRRDLLSKLSESIDELFAAQCQELMFRAYETFSQSLNGVLLEFANSDGSVDENFYQHVEEAKSACANYIAENQSNIEIALLKDLFSIDDRISEKLNEKISDKVAKERQKMIEKLSKIVETKSKSSLQSSLTSTVKKAQADMWRQIHHLYNDTVAAVEKYIDRQSTVLRMTDSERSNLLTVLKNHSQSYIHSVLESHASLIVLYMRKRFDQLFRFDEDGFVRKWKTSDNIRQHFKQCQSEALSLLSLFAYDRLKVMIDTNSDDVSDDVDDAAVDASLVLIPSDRREAIESEFPSEVEGALREAEAEQERLRESRRLPAWGLALIAFLGFDEFLAILRNPLLLILLVIVASALYFAYSTGMLGPAQVIVMQTLKQGARLAQANGINITPLTSMLGIEAEDADTDRHTARAARQTTRLRGAHDDGDVELTSQSSNHSSSQPLRSRMQARTHKAMTITDPHAVKAEIDRVNAAMKHSKAF